MSPIGLLTWPRTGGGGARISFSAPIPYQDWESGNSIDPVVPPPLSREGTPYFFASGLPAGVSINSVSGRITGTPNAKAAGIATVSAAVTSLSALAVTTFPWTVSTLSEAAATIWGTGWTWDAATQQTLTQANRSGQSDSSWTFQFGGLGPDSGRMRWVTDTGAVVFADTDDAPTGLQVGDTVRFEDTGGNTRTGELTAIGSGGGATRAYTFGNGMTIVGGFSGSRPIRVYEVVADDVGDGQVGVFDTGRLIWSRTAPATTGLIPSAADASAWLNGRTVRIKADNSNYVDFDFTGLSGRTVEDEGSGTVFPANLTQHNYGSQTDSTWNFSFGGFAAGSGEMVWQTDSGPLLFVASQEPAGVNPGDTVRIVDTDGNHRTGVLSGRTLSGPAVSWTFADGFTIVGGFSSSRPLRVYTVDTQTIPAVSVTGTVSADDAVTFNRIEYDRPLIFQTDTATARYSYGEELDVRPPTLYGGSGAIVYSASGLPGGTSIDAGTGVISGTPALGGTSNVTLTATDAAGNTDTVALEIVINVTPIRLTVTNDAVPPVYHSGQSGVSEADSTVIWTAMATGGYGSYEYLWQQSRDDGPWLNYAVGTDLGGNWTTISAIHFPVAAVTRRAFRCRARNAADDSGTTEWVNGGTVQWLDLPVTAPPLAPTGLAATAGDEQIALVWTDPGDTSIASYQYRLGAFGAWTTVPGSDATTTEHTVTGLTNGTAYTVQLRAAVSYTHLTLPTKRIV